MQTFVMKRVLFKTPIPSRRVFTTSASSMDEGITIERVRNNTYKFMDRAQLEVRGGRGGNGCVSFEVMSPSRKRPDGGNGGAGGSVFVVADKNLTAMTFRTFHFNAGDGKNGGSDGLTGRCGEDVHIRVPIGTVLSERFPDYLDDMSDPTDDGYDNVSSQSTAFGSANSIDMNRHNMSIQVARGGAAGVGNKMTAGGAGTIKKSMPATVIPGQPGEHRSLVLELKLIADIGLVGYPNAGKSTLLSVLSNARPEIAPYPFTTLHPNIGVVEYSDLERLSVADIPGLIDGAHEDRGLGHDFLRHIERTKLLLFVLDASAGSRVKSGGGSGGEIEPAEQLLSLCNELQLYDSELLNKPALVFANKMDLKVSKVAMRHVQNMAKEMQLEVICGSADTGEGIGELANRLRVIMEDSYQFGKPKMQ